MNASLLIVCFPTELIKRSVCEINSEDIPRTLAPEDAVATAYRNAGCLAVARLLCPESDYTVALDNNLGNDFYIALIEGSTFDEDDYYDEESDQKALAVRKQRKIDYIVIRRKGTKNLHYAV